MQLFRFASVEVCNEKYKYTVDSKGAPGNRLKANVTNNQTFLKSKDTNTGFPNDKEILAVSANIKSFTAQSTSRSNFFKSTGPSLSLKIARGPCDQPEPGSFFSRSFWDGNGVVSFIAIDSEMGTERRVIDCIIYSFHCGDALNTVLLFVVY